MSLVKVSRWSAVMCPFWCDRRAARAMDAVSLLSRFARQTYGTSKRPSHFMVEAAVVIHRGSGDVTVCGDLQYGRALDDRYTRVEGDASNSSWIAGSMSGITLKRTVDPEAIPASCIDLDPVARAHPRSASSRLPAPKAAAWKTSMSAAHSSSFSSMALLCHHRGSSSSRRCGRRRAPCL